MGKVNLDIDFGKEDDRFEIYIDSADIGLGLSEPAQLTAVEEFKDFSVYAI